MYGPGNLTVPRKPSIDMYSSCLKPKRPKYSDSTLAGTALGGRSVMPDGELFWRNTFVFPQCLLPLTKALAEDLA